MVVVKKKDPTDIKDFGKKGGSLNKKEGAALQASRRRIRGEPELTPQLAAEQEARALAFENQKREELKKIVGIAPEQQVQTQQPSLSVTPEGVVATPQVEQPKEELSKINQFGQRIGAGSLVEERKAFTGAIATSAAQIIDAVTSVVSARKQADVIANEQSFNDATKLLKDDIQLVKTGAKSVQEVAKNIAVAQQAIQRLEGSAKGLGRINVRYWLTGGKELETQIILEKQILESLKLELAQAQAEGQAIIQQQQNEQALQQFGLQ